MLLSFARKRRENNRAVIFARYCKGSFKKATALSSLTMLRMYFDAGNEKLVVCLWDQMREAD